MWTANRVAVVIERTFGVRYSRDHVSRILRACGWSRQQPITRATQRDEARSSALGRRSAGRRSKRADEEGATIVWVDESGFYLLPLAVRTWAPRGATPILRVPLTHDHLSAISAITLDGRLFLQVRKENYDGEAVVGFLRVLLRKIAGKSCRHLGWVADPSWAGGQGLPQRGGGQAAAPGAAAGLRAQT